MRGERPDHLLQTTALVHEAYLRLICQRASNIDQRSASKIDQGGFGFLCY